MEHYPICTFTGKAFFPTRPNPDDIDIRDIAHALARLCRFNGHSRHFYSVAEHSIRISDALLLKYNDKQLALQGLLHDSEEAYIGDIASPIKHTIMDFFHLGNLIRNIILIKFNLLDELDPRVVYYDEELLFAERRAMMRGESWWKVPTPKAAFHAASYFSPEVGTIQFLNRFNSLSQALGFHEQCVP